MLRENICCDMFSYVGIIYKVKLFLLYTWRAGSVLQPTTVTTAEEGEKDATRTETPSLWDPPRGHAKLSASGFRKK
jgi:hypothetical protein